MFIYPTDVLYAQSTQLREAWPSFVGKRALHGNGEGTWHMECALASHNTILPGCVLILLLFSQFHPFTHYHKAKQDDLPSKQYFGLLSLDVQSSTQFSALFEWVKSNLQWSQHFPFPHLPSGASGNTISVLCCAVLCACKILVTDNII